MLNRFLEIEVKLLFILDKIAYHLERSLSHIDYERPHYTATVSQLLVSLFIKLSYSLIALQAIQAWHVDI